MARELRFKLASMDAKICNHLAVFWVDYWSIQGVSGKVTSTVLWVSGAILGRYCPLSQIFYFYLGFYMEIWKSSGVPGDRLECLESSFGTPLSPPLVLMSVWIICEVVCPSGFLELVLTGHSTFMLTVQCL